MPDDDVGTEDGGFKVDFDTSGVESGSRAAPG